MFQTTLIVILLVIIVYLIFNKKGIKADDVRLFFENIGVKIKEKCPILLDKIQFFVKKHQKILIWILLCILLTPGVALLIFLMTKRGFWRLIFVALFLVICITPFVYKKTMLDYDGEYATDRLVYTEEYGFCMLITYYPNYKSGNAKGFAVTNIPFVGLFSEDVQANKYGNDTADSKDLLDAYKMLATFGDNTLVDSLAKILLGSKISTKSIQIGKYGNYFATTFKDNYSYTENDYLTF